MGLSDQDVTQEERVMQWQVGQVQCEHAHPGSHLYHWCDHNV